MRITAVSRGHRRGPRGCAALASAATLTAMTAALATASQPAYAALSSHQPGAAAPDATVSSSSLNGVSAVSATDAWATGNYNIGSSPAELLTLHWSGSGWKQVTSPAPSGARSKNLDAVSAASATDAWAVGFYENSSNANLPLTVHWNGTVWKVVKSPAPSGGTGTQLTGVSAVSATDAWAVGNYTPSSGGNATLLLHWNGTAWKQVTIPTPDGATNTRLFAVSADSATDAWAAGQYENSSRMTLPLLLHWNGSGWKQVTSPAPSTDTNEVSGVSAVSATDAWAAGEYQNSSGVYVPLLLHWNGSGWKQVTSPAPSGATFTELYGVSADSATDAWAAGLYVPSSGGYESVTLHWNGTAWKVVKTPAPSGATRTNLYGVSAVSATDAWAAGEYLTNSSSGLPKSLLLHWNGTVWKVVTTPNGT